jgi:glycosyltransferase involved in cell wall biosynthesis
MADDLMAEPSPTRVLVLASTFPASADDPVPAFVLDQVVALATAHPELELHVLAPHDRRSDTRDLSRHELFTEHRFHYAPRNAERLAGRGIMPALRESPWLYLVVPLLFWGEWRALRRLLRELRPALVYAHWFTPQAIVASWATRSRTPFVFTTHASDVDVWHRIPILGARMVRRATSRAKAVTAVSSRSMAKLTAFFPDGLTVPAHIIPMGVDVGSGPASERRSSARATLDLGTERTYLFMGRLVEKKGVEFLLDALAGPGDELGEWRLLIAGDGPLREPLEAHATRLGIRDRVVFTGFVSGGQKAALFAAADVFVVPSVISADGDAEGLPVALLEGLAAGLPCVATYESGADDILTDGVDGLLCEQRDPAALRARLDSLATLTPAARAALAARGRLLAASFSWPEIAERHYEFLFAPLISGGRS